MAHTNETTNYHLSQFIGTDIPNPLTDYNGDMEKIDTAIKAVADSAVSEGARVTALETQNGDAVLTTTAQTLSGAINELDSDLGGVDARLVTAEGKIVSDEATLGNAVDNISTLAGKVSALETKVGSAVLTTVASDCSGAINELDGELGDVATLTTTEKTSVVGAINELDTDKADKVTAVKSVTGDDVKTLIAIVAELTNGVTLKDDAYIKVTNPNGESIYRVTDKGAKCFSCQNIGSSSATIINISPTVAYFARLATNGTLTVDDSSAYAVPNTTTYTLYN